MRYAISLRLVSGAAISVLGIMASPSASLVGTPPVNVFAAGTNGNPCSLKSHYQDGCTGTSDTWGSSAWINARYPNFCLLSTDPMGTDDHTFAWSMVYGPSSGEWAQAGYVMYTNWSSPEIWAEYSDFNPADGCGQGFCDYWSGVFLSPGENHQYYEDLDTDFFTSMDMAYDHTYLVTTPYNPTNSSDQYNWWGQHWRTRYKGEAHFPENDVPGTPAAKASFTSVAHEGAVNSGGLFPPSFNNLPGHTATSDNTAHWCVQNTSGSYSSFNIWTTWNSTCPSPS